MTISCYLLQLLYCDTQPLTRADKILYNTLIVVLGLFQVGHAPSLSTQRFPGFITNMPKPPPLLS